MKIGVQLHPDRGVDAVMAEARRADEQGFDSIWLSDHLMSPSGVNKPDGPLDYFVLMTALGAITQRVRLAWGTLNTTFRPPAVFAKMMTSLDQITHGRVIATLGSGWYEPEYHAYDLRWVEDHDERADYAREVIELLKELWTHPAPETVSFDGKFVRVKDIAFNPAPYQKPHIPIWPGGDSEATLETVKQFGDGWVPLRAASTRESLQAVLGAPTWPNREMTIVKGARIVVGETRDEAIELAKREFEAGSKAGALGWPATFEDFLERDIVGSADEALERLRDIESWGVNYLRLNFQTEAAQEKVAKLLLPRLATSLEPVGG
jgi:alkanesulfonate monooxygenase SsuD/methylene tetrahydromethanopterin reductase-like flavin-dependent oxidoreductase (luciferase family)